MTRSTRIVVQNCEKMHTGYSSVLFSGKMPTSTAFFAVLHLVTCRIFSWLQIYLTEIALQAYGYSKWRKYHHKDWTAFALGEPDFLKLLQNLSCTTYQIYFRRFDIEVLIYVLSSACLTCSLNRFLSVSMNC